MRNGGKDKNVTDFKRTKAKKKKSGVDVGFYFSICCWLGVNERKKRLDRKWNELKKYF